MLSLLHGLPHTLAPPDGSKYLHCPRSLLFRALSHPSLGTVVPRASQPAPPALAQRRRLRPLPSLPPVGPPLVHTLPAFHTAHLISHHLGPVASSLLLCFSTAHIAKEPSYLSHVTFSQLLSVNLPAGFSRLLCRVLPSWSPAHYSSQFPHHDLRHTVLNPHALPSIPCSHPMVQAAVSSRTLLMSFPVTVHASIQTLCRTLVSHRFRGASRSDSPPFLLSPQDFCLPHSSSSPRLPTPRPTLMLSLDLHRTRVLLSPLLSSSLPSSDLSAR